MRLVSIFLREILKHPAFNPAQGKGGALHDLSTVVAVPPQPVIQIYGGTL